MWPLLLLLLSFIVLWWYILQEWVRPKKFPPGPTWIPFIGNGPELRSLARKLGGQHLAHLELAKKYNSDIIGLKLGKEKIVCVNSYPRVREVLTKDEFIGRPDNFFFRLRTLGVRKGITGTDGPLWKEQRAFLVSHLRHLGFGKDATELMIKKEIQNLISEIEVNVDGLDLTKIFSISVLNILWFLTTGQNLRGNQGVNHLLELLHKRSMAFDITGGLLNNFPWLRYIAPEKIGFNLIKKINSELYDFVLEAINNHKENYTEGRSDDVIYAFLTEMKKMEGQIHNFTDDQLVSICLDMFFAGSSITSNSMAFSFLAMLLYPDIQDKVFQCLDNAFDRDEEIYYNDRTRVPYIEAVLLECYRCFSVFPISGPRRVMTPAYLGEYIIPKNTTVFYNLHSVHHDKEYWEDPGEFRPERFLDTNGNLTNYDRMLMFSIGKRKCLGDMLAKSCIFLFFCGIFRKYKITHHESTKKPSARQVPGMIMTTEYYKAKFIARY